MNKEQISVIVPVYNVEKDLKRCVDSILQQTYQNIEIILVDDGSTDESTLICDNYAKNYSNVHVIHKENGGLSDARNTGLRVAKGEYVLYVDSDDYLELDACSKLKAEMQDDVDFVVGVIREVNGDLVTFQRRSRLESGKIYAAKKIIIESIKANELYAPAVLNLYKRQFLIDNNLFFKEGTYFEDTQMLPRLYLAAKKIAYVNYPFYNYIIREGSIMTSANSQKKIDCSVTIWGEWFELFKDVKDKELQRYMYGILIRFYLRNSRARKIIGWKVTGMDFKFAFKYALNSKERLKVVVYTLLPGLYIAR